MPQPYFQQAVKLFPIVLAFDKPSVLGRHLGLFKRPRVKNAAKYENTLSNYHFSHLKLKY